MTSDPERWLTPKDAIVYLGLGSKQALYRLIRDHRLPYGRIGRRYRFSKRRLDLWVESKGGIVSVSRAS